MEMKDILNKLQPFFTAIDIKEIEDLDIACKSTIKHLIINQNLLNSSLIKIQAILDYTYEKINIGNWKDVKPYLRKTMTIVSYLKLVNLLKCHEEIVITENVLRDAFKIVDYGLLFGCPLDTEPKLLQNCAALLNEAYEEISVNKDKIEDANLNKKPIVNNEVATTNQIESIYCPSMESFYSNYISKEKPVILTNCIDHWPALNKWKDQNYLLQLAGLRTVPIELGTKYTDSEWTQKLMTLEEFIKNHIFNTSNTTAYLAQYQLFQQIPELFEDISEPEYCCFSNTNESVDINAWYGPKGTVSPLHHDPKKNLLAQVVGEKRIFLFSPSDSEYVYPHEEELLNNTARVDPREPDLEKYPDYSKATPLHCILRPGQLLYIPPKWWHFVESLSVSFSVSFWWN